MECTIKTDHLRAMCDRIAHLSRLDGMTAEAMIRLEVTDGAAIGRTTSEGVDLETIVACHTETPGVGCIRADKLDEIASQATADEIRIRSEEAHWYRVTGYDSTFRIRGCNPEIFPERPDILDAEPKKTVDAGQLRIALQRAEPAVDSGHASKAQYEAGFLKVSSDQVHVIGTDGKRLTRCLADGEGTHKGLARLPRPAIEPLVRALPKEGTADLLVDGDRLVVHIETPPDDSAIVPTGIGGIVVDVVKDHAQNATYSAVLETGGMPDVESTLDAELDGVAEIDVDQLAALTNFGRVFEDREKSHCVELTLTDGRLEIYGFCVDIGEGRFSVPIDYDGEKRSALANGLHLRQIVEDLPSGTVRLAVPEDLQDPIQILDDDQNQWVTTKIKYGYDRERQV